MGNKIRVGVALILLVCLANFNLMNAPAADAASLGISGKASPAARAGFPVIPGTRMATIYQALMKREEYKSKNSKGLAPLAYYMEQMERKYNYTIDTLADSSKKEEVDEAVKKDIEALREEISLKAGVISANVAEAKSLDADKRAADEFEALSADIWEAVKDYGRYDYFSIAGWGGTLNQVKRAKPNLWAKAIDRHGIDQVGKLLGGADIARAYADHDSAVNAVIPQAPSVGARPESAKLHPALLVSGSLERKFGFTTEDLVGAVLGLKGEVVVLGPIVKDGETTTVTTLKRIDNKGIVHILSISDTLRNGLRKARWLDFQNPAGHHLADEWGRFMMLSIPHENSIQLSYGDSDHDGLNKEVEFWKDELKLL